MIKYLPFILVFIVFASSCKKEKEDNTPVYYTLNAEFTPTVNSCIQTADGNLAVCGYTDGNLFVTKLTTNGNLVWTKTYVLGLGFGGTAILEDNSGNLYTTGNLQGRLFVLKVNQAGDSLWGKNFDGAYNMTGTCMALSPDDCILIGGLASGVQMGLVKITADGSFVFKQLYPAYVQSVTHLLPISDGKYLLTGVSPSSENVQYVKVFHDGGMNWKTANTVPNIHSVCNTIELADGGFITYGTHGLDSANGSQVFLLKCDNAGNQVWKQSYGNNNFETAKYVGQNANGSLVLAGKTQNPTSGRVDGFLFSAAETGDSLWFKYFGSTKDITPVKIFKEANGDNLVVGQISNLNQNSSIFITRTDANGTFK